MHYHIDRFTVLDRYVRVAGWVVGSSPIRSVTLECAGVAIASGKPLPSDDVRATLSDNGHVDRARFDFWGIAENIDVMAAHLRVTFESSPEVILTYLGRPMAADAAHGCFAQFVAMLRTLAPGRFLEIGSRARSGVVHNESIPPHLAYTGFDIMAGSNVDVVGDAHELRKYFEPGTFAAAMAISVLEHILMPWKLVLELNTVMALGGIALFHTHQAWPIHDPPWDFWRFSQDAWPALFNAATGFEIVAAGMGEPTFYVPMRVQASTNFLGQTGFLVSSVIVRKTGSTALSWDVSASDVLKSAYPA